MRITKKPWGLEEIIWLAGDGSLGIKKLLINPNFKTSYHYHIAKKEFFYVRKGEVRVKLGNLEKRLEAGDGLYIPNGKVHQITNVGRSELVIVEFAVNPNDTDVVRIQDPYGREER
jgi:mannose-1-phosphate guanylyltransferase